MATITGATVGCELDPYFITDNYSPGPKFLYGLFGSAVFCCVSYGIGRTVGFGLEKIIN